MRKKIEFNYFENLIYFSTISYLIFELIKKINYFTLAGIEHECLRVAVGSATHSATVCFHISSLKNVLNR